MSFTAQSDLRAAIYNNSDMIEFTRVAPSTLKYWRRESAVNIGTRNSNNNLMYSIADMLSIKLITKLAIESRLPVTQAVSASDMAADWFAENYNKDTCSKACLVVYSDAEPQIANDSAELESILNDRSGAVVVRLSSFLKSAISPSMSTAA